MEQSRNKECKSVTVKYVYQVKCTIALFWNFGNSAAVILWIQNKIGTSFRALVSKKAAIWWLKESQSNDKHLQKAVISSYQMK